MKNLQLQTAGTTRITVLKDNGHVGIGTTNPAEKLEVAGNVRLNDGGDAYIANTGGYIGLRPKDTKHGLLLRDYTGGSTNWSGLRHVKNAGNDRLEFSVYNSGNYGKGLVLTQNSRVGIGLTNPASKLHVSGTTRTTSLRITSLAGTGTRMVITDANGNISQQAIPQNSGYIGDNGIHYAGGELRMGSYSLEAGTITGNSNLTIKGKDEVGSKGAGAGTVYVYGGVAASTTSQGDVVLAHTGSSPNGHVGVGVANPVANLEVVRAVLNGQSSATGRFHSTVDHAEVQIESLTGYDALISLRNATNDTWNIRNVGTPNSGPLGTSPGDFAITRWDEGYGVDKTVFKISDEDIVYIGAGDNIGDVALSVRGKVSCKEVICSVDPETQVPDYVFADGYSLQSLEAIESYVKKRTPPAWHPFGKGV